jgi:hypothetical protein
MAEIEGAIEREFQSLSIDFVCLLHRPTESPLQVFMQALFTELMMYILCY